MSSRPGSYRPRVIDPQLDEFLTGLPAIALEGARAVGKTMTAGRRASSVFRLDDPRQRELADADLDRVVDAPPPVLIDEWQLIPAVWDRVRRRVDDGAAAGSYLLTGSSSSPGGHAHSGAGRIVSLRMRPFSLAERSHAPTTVSLGELLRGAKPSIAGDTAFRLTDYTEEITMSGFPGIRPLTPRLRQAQLDGYLRLIVERDFADLGTDVANPQVLRRWMAAYAAATATTASLSTIAQVAAGGDANPPARTTIKRYRDGLERLYVLEPLPGWLPSGSRLGRLSEAPKHHLADPALAARLVGATAESLLENRGTEPAIVQDGSFLGCLFESLATLSVRVYAQAGDARVGHLRRRDGAREIDLIVERDDGRIVALEVKLGETVSERDTRHLRWLSEQLGDRVLDSAIVTTGRYAYRGPDGVAVVPLALLGP